VIDFRYHLVSLISVFLALAVGIVLGAGPLRESLGTQLAGQVEQLRTEKDSLRTDNDNLTAANDQLGTYITQTAPTLVAGTLTGRSVAVITDDSSTRTSVEQLSVLATDAGGAVPVRVTLGTTLWDPAGDADRAAALAALRTATPGLELSGDDDAQRLSSAVVTVLTASSDELGGDERAAALDALVSSQIVTVDGQLDGPVDGLVYASAAPDQLVDSGDDDAAAATRAQLLNTAQTAILTTIVDDRIPSVVAGSTPGSDDTTGIIRTARGGSRFSSISTADGLQRADGPPVAVLALAEQFAGGAGDYGTGAGAQARLPENVPGSGGTGDAPAASDGGQG